MIQNKIVMKPAFLPLLILFSILLPSFLMEKGASKAETGTMINPSEEPTNLPESLIRQRQKTCERIVYKLLEAKGIANIPEVIYDTSHQMVAWASYRENKIGMEHNAYEVCRGFGKDSLNALAALLAHEVVHYAEKDSWEFNFAAEFRTMGIGEEVRSSFDRKVDETKADYIGGFLGYAAGFQTLGVMPELLTRIYKEYTLPDDLSNYPSFQERKRMAEEGEKKLEKLIDAFDFANFLAALGEYEDAYQYYQFILAQNYESREIFNNLGVIATLAAMEYFDFGWESDELPPYTFPVELDEESRIVSGSKSTEQTTEEQKASREKYLREAIGFFRNARMLDRRYAIAQLNEGCAQLLLTLSLTSPLEREEQDDARYEAEDAALDAVRNAQRMNKTKTEGDAHILLGLIAAFKGEKEKAKSYFEKADELGSKRLANANTKVLNGERNMEDPFGDDFTFPCSSDEETIAGKLLSEMGVKSITNIKEVFNEVKREDVVTMKLFGKKLEQASALANFVRTSIDGDLTLKTSLLITSLDYSGKTACEISLQDPFEAIKEAYQEPDETLELGNGVFLIYSEPPLIFQLDAQDRLKKWAIYKNDTEIKAVVD
jgi:hypothetical protein